MAVDRTSLMNHIRFFDTNRDDTITIPEMYGQLRKLGLDPVTSASFSVLTAVGRGLPSSGSPFKIDVKNIDKAIFEGNAGVFDKTGVATRERADALFDAVDANRDGKIDPKEISARLLLDAPKRLNRMVESIGWKLLMHFVKKASGQEGLSREQVQKIYTGEIFQEILDLKAANKK